MRKREKKVFYVDGIDWQHEIGATSTEFFDTKEDLLANKKCVKKGGCGIVRVEMYGTWVQKQDLRGLK